MKVSAPTGRSANNPAKSPKRTERGGCTKTIDTAPIATPMTARSTTGATFRRTATGWETATTTSRVARTARSRTILSIEAESYPVATSGGKVAAAFRCGEVPAPGRPATAPTGNSYGSAAARQIFRLVWAEIDQHANPAQRFAGHADITAVQDQPVMSMQQKAVRDDAHKSVFDLARRFAGRDGEAVGDSEHVGVDGQRRLAEDGVEHHIGSLAANTRQGFQLLTDAGGLTAVLFDDGARKSNDVFCLGPIEPDRLDQIGNLLDAESRHLLRGIGDGEQRRCGFVHARVGRLRR